MLKVKKATMKFGGVKALKDCTLQIQPGKITGLIGPNGSGKSTLFNTISKLIKLNHGKIYFQGKHINKLSDFKVARLGISRTFQDVRLFRNLTIKQHIEIALNGGDESLLKSLFTKEKDKTKLVKKYLKIVGLDKPLGTYATDLSYGQRKLLDLAIGLAKKHSLLMLDEPVAGVNPKLREDIKKVLKRLKKEGETILVIEHDMHFLMDIADEIWVLDAGSVIAQGKPSEIQNNKCVLNAYLGE